MRTRDGTRTGVVSPTRAVLSIAKIEIFFIFVIPKQQKKMTKKETLPLWYGAERRKPLNAFVGVGHLNRKGFNIPKQQKKMTKKETAVIIDGKKIDLKDWFVSNKEKGLEYTAFDQVQDLGFILNDILGVCACALYNIDENPSLNQAEQCRILGASALSVANVLKFAQTLIPQAELGLLTEIQESIKE